MTAKVVFTDVNEDDWDWFPRGEHVIRRIDENRLPLNEFMLMYSNDSESRKPWVKAWYEKGQSP